MALTVNTVASCKNIFVVLNYTSSQTQTMRLKFYDADNADIGPATNPQFTIPSGSGPINHPIPLSDLSISNGVIDVIVELQVSNGQWTVQDRYAVLINCDIDCCLTKLTNELIDCSCDCAKCASSLAKAQKVFLLVQANDAGTGTRSGYINDANTKYLKAKEVCDDSCGCNC